MGKYRMVYVDFWNDPVVIEEMTPEDRYFYLYLLTNTRTTQIGIYKITKKLMAFDLGYSIESVHSLMDRFINHHKLIRYNTETRELAIRDWGKDNLRNVGKPVINCIVSELGEVEDTSLISYVAEHIGHGPIQDIYESFCVKEDTAVLYDKKAIYSDYNTYINPVIPSADDSYNDTSTTRDTIRGQKEKEEEKEKEKQQQKDLNPSIEENLESDQTNKVDAKNIIEFWDKNGFGYINVNAKQQLLTWLNNSSFLHPKEIILKAMQIACTNNKRKLNYIIGILKNWENESLLTVEEIDLYNENEYRGRKQNEKVETVHRGRDIPTDSVFDITDGEK